MTNTEFSSHVHCMYANIFSYNSPIRHTALKIKTKNILVHVQGERVESCHVGRPQLPTVLCWHPTKPVLALGWDKGEVVLLTHPSGDQTVLPGIHAACITLLEWSGFGSRLVTGDEVSVLQYYSSIII